MNKTVPILTINYNGSEDTLDLIQSLEDCGDSYFLTIVDTSNGDEDANKLKQSLRGLLKDEFKEVSLKNNFNFISWCYVAITNKNNSIVLAKSNRNGGFSFATNLCYKITREFIQDFDYVTILNNDTTVTCNFLTKIISEISKDPLIAAGTGTILYYDRTKGDYIWSIGGNINFTKACGVHLCKDSIFDYKKYKTPIERKFISGCFTIFKKECFDAIGMLDERYYFGTEEFQYSLDLTKKGYKLLYVPDSIIYHKSQLGLGHGSSHSIVKIEFQYNSYINKLIFINHNKNFLYRFFWRILFFSYLKFSIVRKYKKNCLYTNKQIKTMMHLLFKNRNAQSFTLEDFLLIKDELYSAEK